MPNVDTTLPSYLDKQPIVMEVDPMDGSSVSATSGVKLVFSVPVDPSSVDERSIAVMPKPESLDQEEIAEDIVDRDVEIWVGQYSVSDDGLQVSFQPEAPYFRGRDYILIVTSALRSVELVPFNQTPGSSPTPFISAFSVVELIESNDGPPAGADQSSGDSSTDSTQDGAGDTVVEPVIVRPSWLLISEVLYDVPGADTDGDVFIELVGEANMEIGGYVMAFVNGSDGKIYDTVKIPDGTTVPDDGVFLVADAITGSPGTSRVDGADLIVNFDPQNGPDAVQLLDEEGKLLDSVGYGEPIVQLAENGLFTYEGTPAQDVGSGMSIARVDIFDTDDNSVDFIQMEIPTPGAIEAVAP